MNVPARFYPANNTTIGEKWPSPHERPAENPFLRDGNGRIKSPSAITKLVKENPQLARELCRQAREPLSAWFPDNPP